MGFTGDTRARGSGLRRVGMVVKTGYRGGSELCAGSGTSAEVPEDRITAISAVDGAPVWGRGRVLTFVKRKRSKRKTRNTGLSKLAMMEGPKSTHICKE